MLRIEISRQDGKQLDIFRCQCSVDKGFIAYGDCIKHLILNYPKIIIAHSCTMRVGPGRRYGKYQATSGLSFLAQVFFSFKIL